MKEDDKGNSFFDPMFKALVNELKEDLKIAMLERHDDGCESEEESALRIDRMLRIVGETCKVEELKEAKENVKKEKSIEGEDKRIVSAKRDAERDLVNASDSDLDSDGSDDKSEEEHGDEHHELHDGQIYCASLI